MDYGYLIVKTFDCLYNEYKNKYMLKSNVYGIPRIDIDASNYNIKYRGIDRDCLGPNDINPLNLAEVRIKELKNSEYDYENMDFIEEKYLADVFSWLEKDIAKYEVIFVRKNKCKCPIPENYKSIGFEPSYFVSDHFSASCDCMLFPRWHGTDKEGVLFIPYFKKLNKYGLFNTSEEADNFLEYYLSLDWTETGDYFNTEVFISNKKIA